MNISREHLNNSLLVECFYGIMKFLIELFREVILFTILTNFYAHSSIENVMNGTFMVVINFLVFLIDVVSFIFAHFPIFRGSLIMSWLKTTLIFCSILAPCIIQDMYVGL